MQAVEPSTPLPTQDSATASRAKLLARLLAKSLSVGLSVGLSLTSAFAAVDVNTASRAQLETVRGIGPSMSAKIVTEREKRGPFKSSQDLAKRVSGIGEKTVKRLQDNGLKISAQKMPEPSKPTGRDAGVPKQRASRS